MERKMFYGANPDLFAKAKQLRGNMTEAEIKLWNRLRENQLSVRFKPQHPLDIFIADFYCHSLKLIIEVDGSVHELQKDYDEGRTNELKKYNIKVVRFTNEEVFNDIENVIRQIKITIENLKSNIDLDKEI